jgi:hypothetical protein
MGRRKVDWSEVEPLYRAGVLSVSEIARQFDVTETAVRKHAKQHKWKRDLAAKVRAKTTQILIEDLADGSKDGSNGSNPQRARESEEETTERAALTQIAIVRQHKAMIGDGLDLAVRMLSELKATTSHVGELEGMLETDDKIKRSAGLLRAIGVPTRITALRDFATACRTLVGLERQAFSIVEEKEPPPAPMPEPRTLAACRT